jgi:hypothetical protein
LLQTQERKAQLEDEIVAYEDRMKKLNVELKKLQCFHKESEIEVRSQDWAIFLLGSPQVTFCIQNYLMLSHTLWLICSLHFLCSSNFR